MQSLNVSALRYVFNLDSLYNSCVKHAYIWLDRLKRDIERIKDSKKSNVLFINELGFSENKFALLIDNICNNQSIKRFDMKVCPLHFSIYQIADFSNS